MLPTSAGVEPATSWSPVGRRIQLSHEAGRPSSSNIVDVVVVGLVKVVVGGGLVVVGLSIGVVAAGPLY